MNFAGRVYCSGAAGLTEIQVCPGVDIGGTDYIDTGSQCRVARSTNGVSAGLTTSCAPGYDYVTWAWDYIPEDIPSSATIITSPAECV